MRVLVVGALVGIGGGYRGRHPRGAAVPPPSLHYFLILVTPYLKENIKAAANRGLVDVEVIERENQIENTNENLQDSDVTLLQRQRAGLGN